MESRGHEQHLMMGLDGVGEEREEIKFGALTPITNLGSLWEKS